MNESRSLVERVGEKKGEEMGEMGIKGVVQAEAKQKTTLGPYWLKAVGATRPALAQPNPK